MTFEAILSAYGSVSFNFSLILGSIIMNINCHLVVTTLRNILRLKNVNKISEVEMTSGNAKAAGKYFVKSHN